MKKQFLVILTLALITLSSIAFAGQDVIEVKLNESYIDFTDSAGNRVDPTIINSRTMVPMRKIFETLGANIEWDGSTQKVTATTENKEIVLQINNTQASLKDLTTNEQKTITLDSAPVILNDRTMVPVRFIAESLEKQVGWDAPNRVVVIIDYDEIIKDLSKNCSTFIDMINEQKTEIKTFDESVTLKGTLNYKDSENSKNNEKLVLDGTMNIKKSEDKLQVSINLKITGKGQLYDALKEEGYNKIAIDIIGDIENNEAYIKMSPSSSKKWIKVNMDLSDALKIEVKENNLADLIRLPEEALTKDSYETLAQTIEMLKVFLGNDIIKVSGKSTKTYTMKWGLEDVLKALNADNSDNINELLSLGKATLEIGATYKNGMNTKGSAKLNIDWQMKDTKERVTVDITGDAKFKSYNKDVKITLPSASEIEK